MRPIASVARLELRDVPEFKAFALPGRVSIGRLIAAGNGMAVAARPHAHVFVESGLPGEFVEQLEAAVQELQRTVDSKGLSRSLRVKDTSGLYKDALNARGTVGVLDALITAELPDHDPLLDQWKNVRRVVRAATGGAAARPPAGGSTAAATSSGGSDSPSESRDSVAVTELRAA